MNKLIKDIDNALATYPTLKKVTEGVFIRVKGEIPLIHPEKGEFDQYKVLIKFTKNYPKCFPKVIETSEKIPRKDFRHVNHDNTLCFAVEPEEQVICKNGITFKFFLDKVLVPHLARETYRESKGFYPDGEYEHGYNGIWQYYESILDKKDKQSIIIELEQVVNSTWPKRNDKCSCGSGKKFKKCHHSKWLKVLKTGKPYLQNQIQILKYNINNE